MAHAIAPLSPVQVEAMDEYNVAHWMRGDEMFQEGMTKPSVKDEEAADQFSKIVRRELTPSLGDVVCTGGIQWSIHIQHFLASSYKLRMVWVTGFPDASGRREIKPVTG